MCPAQFSPVKSRFIYLTATSNLHLDVDGPQQSSPSSPSKLSSLSSPSLLLTAPSSHFLKPNTLETPLTHLFLSHPHPICQQILLVQPSKYIPNPSPTPFFHLHGPHPGLLHRQLPPGPLQSPPLCFCPRCDELFPISPPEGACEALNRLWSLSRALPCSVLLRIQAKPQPQPTQPCIFLALSSPLLSPSHLALATQASLLVLRHITPTPGPLHLLFPLPVIFSPRHPPPDSFPHLPGFSSNGIFTPYLYCNPHP